MVRDGTFVEPLMLRKSVQTMMNKIIPNSEGMAGEISAKPFYHTSSNSMTFQVFILF